MNDMNKITLIFLVALCTGSLSGQTVIIVTDAFQGQGKFERGIHDAMIDHAETIIHSANQSSEIFAFNCSGDGMHHASGFDGVGMHLDSLRSDEIAVPLESKGWNGESEKFMKWAIQSKLPKAQGGYSLYILADQVDVSKLTAQFLWPFAMVFDCLDNKGQLIPGVEFTIHSGFNGEISSQSVTHISF